MLRTSGLFLGVRPNELRGLAATVAFLAVLELLVGGFLLPAIRQPFEGELVVYVTSLFSTFARNLGAILAVVLSALYLLSLVRAPGLGASRRLALALLGILAQPIQALALFVEVTPEMVFLSYTATYFFCALTVLSAVRWPSPLHARIGLGLLLMPHAAAFAATIAERLSHGGSDLVVGLLLLRTLDLGGEALVVLVALLVPFVLVPAGARSLRRPPGLVAGILALLPATGYVAVQAYGGDRVSELCQAALGLELFFFSPLYLIGLFGVTWTVLVNLLPAPSPAREGKIDLGLGLVLVAAAGQDAHTPYRLALLLLGFQILGAAHAPEAPTVEPVRVRTA